LTSIAEVFNAQRTTASPPGRIFAFVSPTSREEEEEEGFVTLEKVLLGTGCFQYGEGTGSMHSGVKNAGRVVGVATATES
jgi:hypothetical protein